MVTFDGRAAGTPAATWAASPRLADLPGLALPLGRVAVLAAHPDDETLGAGGLLHRLARAGRHADVVVVTDGSGSHPGSAVLPPADLVRLRAREVADAVALLQPGGQTPPRLLGFRDGSVREDRDAITAALDAVLADDVTTLVVPWRGDGHRDHRVLGEIGAELAARRGARLLEYPLWLWHWADPDHPDVPWDRLRALPLDPVDVVARHRALAAHGTQISPASPAPEDAAPLHAEHLRRADRDVDLFVVPDDAADGTTAPADTGTGTGYFEAAYARRDDPWRLATRWYEERKRALTLAVLPAARYGSALEIGCSVGVLTAALAPRCDRLLATDLVDAAVTTARTRVADQPHVRVVQHDARTGVPDGPHDLVVLSEVGYYLARDELVALAGRVRDALADGGTVVACHWRHPVREHAQTGDDVHLVLDRVLGSAGSAGVDGLAEVGRYRDEDVVLQVWSTDAASVARREGLVP